MHCLLLLRPFRFCFSSYTFVYILKLEVTLRVHTKFKVSLDIHPFQSCMKQPCDDRGFQFSVQQFKRVIDFGERRDAFGQVHGRNLYTSWYAIVRVLMPA